jgi:menaquinone-dependent protoporphyrinogen oxidase
MRFAPRMLNAEDMMKLFIGYATNEGQTRKIAQHIADRCVDQGHAVELMGLADATTIMLSRFDAAILGGSLHAGHYQKVLSEFAADHATALDALPTLLISVSLAAAGHDAEDWRTLDAILADFQDATSWIPGQVAQVAGAYKPSDYDVFRRFIMRRIIAQKDPEADLDWDKEYTDWDSLNDVIDTWLAGLAASHPS